MRRCSSSTRGYLVREAKPRRFVLENVYALTYNNKASRPALDRLMREIDDAGYDCRAKVLNAADYGVPQSRPRLFVIGVPKGELLPHHPEPTHGGPWERRMSGDPKRSHVTAGQALADLVTEPELGESVNGKYGHLLPAIPPDDNYLFYTAFGRHADERAGRAARRPRAAAGSVREHWAAEWPPEQLARRRPAVSSNAGPYPSRTASGDGSLPWRI